MQRAGQRDKTLDGGRIGVRTISGWSGTKLDRPGYRPRHRGALEDRRGRGSTRSVHRWSGSYRRSRDKARPGEGLVCHWSSMGDPPRGCNADLNLRIGGGGWRKTLLFYRDCHAMVARGARRMG